MNYIRIRQVAFGSLCGYAATSMLTVSVANIFLGVSFLCSCLLIKKNYKKIYIPPRIIIAILAFFSAMLISCFFADNLQAAFERYIKSVLCLSSLFCVLSVADAFHGNRKIVFAIAISAICSGIVAFFQGICGDYRAAVFFSNSMYYAGFLVQIIPTAIILIFCNLTDKKIYSLMLFVSVAGLLFNGTRGAWIAVFISVIILFFLLNIKLKKLCKYIAIVGVVLISLGSYDNHFIERLNSVTDMKYQSNSERLLLWNSALEMWQDNPVFGVGTGNFELQYRNKYISPLAKERGLGHPHNNVLAFLSEVGLVGAGAYLYMIYIFLNTALNEWKKGNQYALIFFSATIGLFLQGMTESNFGNSIVMKFYYMLMGLFLVSLPQYNNSDEKDSA